MLLLVWALFLLIFNNYHMSDAVDDEDKLIFCMYLSKDYGNYKAEDIDEHYCTHLIYAYMGVDDNGAIKSLNPTLDFREKSGRGNIRKFNNKKHYNMNLKTLIGVGGWDPTESSGRYSLVFGNEENQDTFVKTVIDFIVKYNFNGLALHWTYPGINGGDPNKDKHTFTSLLRKLKQELSKKNFLFVVICHGLTSRIDESYNIKEVSQNVDYIILRSYDLYGDWSDHIGISSALYVHPNEEDNELSVDSVVTNWINRGAEPNRIIMGVPLFGRTFTLKYENQTDPGSLHVGPGLKSRLIKYPGRMSYMELCQVLDKEGWTIKWEETQKNPYAFKGDQWVAYENTRSLEIKSKYIFERKLAGIAVVYVEDDDFRGLCGEKYSRLKLINGLLQSDDDSSFEYILNVSVFKKNLKNQYTQCVYHLSQPLEFTKISSIAKMLLLVWALFFLIFNNYRMSDAADDEDKLIFCMYLSKSVERQGDGNYQVEFIDERYCTHLIYAYMGVDDNGAIKSLNPVLDFEEKSGRGNIRKFNNKKHYNINLKTLVAVGGWDPTETSRRYSLVFGNEENQDTFVRTAVDFIVKYNFNGLAFHWTYPGINGGDPNRDRHSFTSLLRKLKQELSKKNLLLVAICQGLTGQIDESYNVKDVSQNVDYIYLTSYDLYGEWSKHIGIASGLYLHPNEEDTGLSVDSVVSNWINRGAEPQRLIMGVPLFGRTFTLKYENQTEPGSFHVGPGLKSRHIQFAGLMSYMELCQVLDKEGWNIKWEETQKNPYAFKDDQWVAYENTRSLEIKSKYIIERKLAGIAAVFVEDDDFRGLCGEKYPRLKLINGYLRSGRDSSFEYILNVSVFKKNLKDQYTQCVYHLSQPLDVS